MTYVIEVIIALLITDNIRLRVSRREWRVLAAKVLADYRESVDALKRWNAEDKRLLAHMESECARVAGIMAKADARAIDDARAAGIPA